MPDFLLFDAHHDLSSKMQELGHLLNFSFRTATTLNSFQKEASTPCDAYLLVESEEISPPSQLISKLKEKDGRPIAFFGKKFRSCKNYRILKERFHVDYVLEFPIKPDEVASLMRTLTKKEEPTDLSMLEILPPSLIEKYDTTVFEKLERVEEKIQEIHNQKGSHQLLEELRNEIHKIAGSAGGYGYGDASLVCKKHELFLHEIYGSDSTNITLGEIDAANHQFLRELRLFFQRLKLTKIEVAQVTTPRMMKKKEKLPETQPQQVAGGSFLTLACADFHVIKYFQECAIRHQLTCIVESNPRALLNQMKERENEAPCVLITDEFFPYTTTTGKDLIEAAKQKWNLFPPRFVLITDSDDLEKRMEWLNEGISLVLKRPITENNVESVFQQFSDQKNVIEATALIVDDDEETGLVELKILESLGLTAHYLQDETRIMKSLEEINPDILLLDIMMPKFSGKELLQTLRSDVRFRHLIIIIVTASEEQHLQEWAYASQCDEVIHKPINRDFLKSKVMNLLKRKQSTQTTTHIDTTTSFYTKDRYARLVEDILQKREGKAFAELYLVVDLWENLVTYLSNAEGKEVLIIIADLIKQIFHEKTAWGYLENGVYAILFSEKYGGEIEALTTRFFQEMSKKIWISGKENLKVTMSGALCLFEAGKITLDQVRNEAIKLTKQASDSGSMRIITRRLTESSSVSLETKKVILIDDDKDLTDVIRFIFEQNGFDISIFHTGEEALVHFAKMENLSDNTLIILDRMLPDRDGLTILSLLNEKFPGKIKALVLSSLSTEQDMLDGLKQGAMDYMTKPFSVQVLLQKALIMLSH